MGSPPSEAKRLSIAGMDDRFFACLNNASLFALQRFWRCERLQHENRIHNLGPELSFATI